MNSNSHLDHPMSPFSFMAIISRRLPLILLLFVIIVASIVGAAFLLPPVYESSSKLLVNYLDDYEKQTVQVSGKTPYDLIATEMSIIKTSAIVEPVVDELHLSAFSENADEAAAPELLRNQAVAHVLATLKVEREKDTNVLLLTYADGDPVTAANVVNGIVQQYAKQRPRISKDERAFEFFNKEIEVLRVRIDSMEAKSLMYKKLENVLVPDKQSEIMFASLAEFDRELTRVRAERIAKEARLRVVHEQMRVGQDISLSSSDDWSKMDHLNQLRQSLLQLKIRKNSLKMKYTDKHPEVQTVKRDMENTETEIAREVQSMIDSEDTNLRTFRAQENELARSMTEMAANIADFSRKEFELGRRTIGIDDLKQVYSALLRHREEARIAANKKEFLVQVRVLEPAAPPASPVKPNKKLYAAIALVVGLFVSFGSAFFAEYFDHSIYSVEDAMESTGLMILAVLSDAEPRRISMRATSRSTLSVGTADKR